MIDDFDLKEDSLDLTDEEVSTALEVHSVEALIDQLKSLSCSSCGGRTEPSAHQLRRRKPSLYWRVHLRCVGACGVKPSVVYKVCWMRDE